MREEYLYHVPAVPLALLVGADASKMFLSVLFVIKRPQKIIVVAIEYYSENVPQPVSPSEIMHTSINCMHTHAKLGIH